ncbi:uncharacterized protein LOC18446677 isoform X2 [Amborella trichopoda]|uniref:DUF3128 domain-containing protein n=1 Tax=Amborella trichopoda TaxID=13333 RepID=U5CY93_AMBTC|nr:uncharacterized protein LOC18446677 isoform X2 [Amborella trichopoda]ERN18316.1 hypothetical protein AMTR_s00055p00184890 [Amborella trichopoda]|eukprot:XP_006856849.1 uncharacterized protein LOC18446677 isoform X2 [Amborella trichopoda]
MDSSSTEKRQRLSCTKYFDALWFCYSPVHQMQQYYRLGVLDNCSEKWNALVDCLNLKTKRTSEVEEILEAREKSRTHIWSFRNVEEASTHWQELFGHINEGE